MHRLLIQEHQVGEGPTLGQGDITLQPGGGSMHSSALSMIVAVVVSCLLTVICAGKPLSRLGESAPTPLRQPVLFPSPTPGPGSTSTASVRATQEPLLWVGPVLYLPQPLGLEQAGFPAYDLGAGKARWVQTSEPIYEILDWAPDGCKVAYWTYDKDQIRVLDIHSMQDTNLVTFREEQKLPVRLRWSPGGEWIAYTSMVSQTGNTICLVRPDGSNHHRLLPEQGDIWSIAGWAEDGQQLLFWSYKPSRRELHEGLWQLNALDLASLVPKPLVRYAQPLESWADLVITDAQGLRALLWTGFDQPEEAYYVDLDWSTDLRYFLVITYKGAYEGYSDLYIVDRVDRTVRKLNAKEFRLDYITLSDNGLFCAFVGQGFDQESAADERTYVVDIVTGKVRVLGQEAGIVLWNPVWSPDSTMLSFIQPYGGDALGFGSYVYHLASRKVIARLPDTLFDYHSPVLWFPRTVYGPGACGGNK